jgi:hypothetical protein
MLTKRDFVVPHLDIQTHLIQRKHKLCAHTLSLITGGKIEVPTNVMRDGMEGIRSIFPDEKELRFWTYVELPTTFLNASEEPLEQSSWISSEWSPVRKVDIAEQSSSAAFRDTPWKDGVGFNIRFQAHVAFLNPCEPLHRGTIKPDTIRQGILQSTNRNIHALH